MAITPAKQNLGCKTQWQYGNNICHKQIKLPKIIGNNICQTKIDNIRVHKITALTNTVTPFSVGNAWG